MPNLNRVMLMGNLTRDPELRFLPNTNTPVVGIGLAINRRWKNQQGEQQDEVAFIDCEAFGRTAEVINQYLRKGRPIYVEGRLKYDQWQDKEGNKRSKLKVVVESFEFIDSRGGGGEGGGEGGSGFDSASSRPQGQRRPAPAPGNAPAAGSAPSDAGEPHQPVGEDDIPF